MRNIVRMRSLVGFSSMGAFFVFCSFPAIAITRIFANDFRQSLILRLRHPPVQYLSTKNSVLLFTNNPRVMSSENTASSSNNMDATELVDALHKLINKSASKKGKLVKESHFVHLATNLELSSWKMSEWEYKRENCPFPTMARGLFTRSIKADEKGETVKRHEIVVRGYDKFFNIGEVKRTEWSWIETHTTGPYEITTKENGCIIFFAGLPGDELLVTSKHSMGELRPNDDKSHAAVGEKWAQRHLESVGLTKKDFAKWLRENNMTAVAELCDDAFEEHVLEYPEHRRGLYFHGLNYNTPTLRTLPSSDVTEAAQRFGFRTTGYITRESAAEVKQFTDEVKKTGEYEGTAVEGFVVRCKLEAALGGVDFFFKIKYDEPYLMYREWRELTKAIIAGRNTYRCTYELSRHYVNWVQREIKKQPELFNEYTKNKGIIKVRDMFQEWWEKEGKVKEGKVKEGKVKEGKVKEDLSGENAGPQDEKKQYRKYCLVPIATIGCGKTTVSLALKELFGFMHIQNDNITQKNTATKFYNTIIDGFEEHDVVIADRNNHLVMHRDTLTNTISAGYPNTRFIALYWAHDKHPISEIFAATSGRVHARGDNHQTLHPTEGDVDPIIRMFIDSFAAYDPLSNPGDEAISDVIELDPLEDEFTTLRKTVSQLCPLIGVPPPSESEMHKALDNAKKYRPTVRKVVKNKAKSKDPKYFGVQLDGDVCTLLTRYLAKYKATVDDVTQKRFQQFIATKRVPNHHHITLVHAFDLVSLEGEKRKVTQAIWDKYSEKMEGGKENQRIMVRFRSLISTERLMTLEVGEIVPAEVSNPNRILHVTVGTALDEIKAIESNVVLEALLRNEGQVPQEHGEVKRMVFEEGEQVEIGGMIKAFYY